MNGLVEARRVRARLAADDPPIGWPTTKAIGENRIGKPVPKCTMIDCAEPGIYSVKLVALTVDFCSMSTFACHAHLDWVVNGAADWVRQP